MQIDPDKKRHANRAGRIDFNRLGVGRAVQAFGAQGGAQRGGVFDNPLGIAVRCRKICIQHRNHQGTTGHFAGFLIMRCIGGRGVMRGFHHHARGLRHTMIVIHRHWGSICRAAKADYNDQDRRDIACNGLFRVSHGDDS